MRKLAAFTVGVLLSSRLVPQSLLQEERVLLPIYVEPTPGAHSSLWVSDLWVHNANDSYAQIFPGAADWPGVAPQTTIRPLVPPRRVGFLPGLFIWIRTTQPTGVYFNLRIRDVSREVQNSGTEIPVIREGEFRTGRINLVNIPLRDGFRQMLRMFQVLNTGDAPGHLRVRFFRVTGDGAPDAPPFREEVVTLSGTPPYDPGYAQLNDLGTHTEAPAVRIEIEPLSPGVRYWAFVSVVNNETQQLTTVTPQ